MGDTHGQSAQQPQLGLWDAVSIILGIIIGAGIYETTPSVFRDMPSAGLAYSLWAICGILVFVGALCYAELATTYPRDGGDYVYLTRAYHPLVGYLFGWTQLAVVQTASIGLMAYIFADYGVRLHVLPVAADDALAGQISTLLYACGAIVLITALNLAGVRLGRPVQNFLTLVKIVGLAGIVVVAVAFAQRGQVGGHELMVGSLVEIPKDESAIVVMADPGYSEFDEDGEERRDFDFAVNEGAGGTRLLINFKDKIKDGDEEVPVTLDHFARFRHVVIEYDKNDPRRTALLIRTVKTGLSAVEIMGAMVLILLTFGGWNDAAFVAAEVRDPGRNIPRALVLGTLGVMAIYLLINWAFVTALGWEAAQNSQEIAADVLRLLPGGYGKYGETLMCVLVMISALGAINGLIFTSSRIYATLGADYSLFSWLARRHGRSGAPVASLLIQMLISLAMVIGVGLLSGNRNGFFVLLKCTAPVFWFFFLLTALSLFILRFRDPHRPRPFRVPAFPVLPLLFVATCGYMLWSGINYAGELGLIGGALVLAGLPFYFLSRRTAPAVEPIELRATPPSSSADIQV
jgi:amino acid transporter